MKGKHTIIHPTINGVRTAVPVTLWEADVYGRLLERSPAGWHWVDSSRQECAAMNRLVKKGAAVKDGNFWRQSGNK